MSDFSAEIGDLEELQRLNAAMIAELKPSGALGRAVQRITLLAQRYAIDITHRDTGALAGSHRVDVQGHQGRIFLDPSASNPRSRQLVSRYGAFEHERGGDHAFYERTANEADRFVGEGVDIIVQGLKGA